MGANIHKRKEKMNMKAARKAARTAFNRKTGLAKRIDLAQRR